MGILAVRPAGLAWLLGIVAACAAVFLAAGRIVSVFASPPQSARAPQIETDQLKYLAGEAINISGEQFDAFEHVTLRVAHPGAPLNGRGGLASFSVTADDEGRFQARWSIDRHDAGGNHFIVTAEGTSGSRADAAFDRAGILAAEQPLDFAAGHLRVHAEGFNENEPVTLRVGDGHDVVTLPLVSDEHGAFSAPLDLPGANPDAAMLLVVATGNMSGLKLSLALTEYAIAAPLPNGIPALNALRSEKGLAQAGWTEKAASYDLFISWNATAWAGRTGNACALFDTGGKDLVGIAVCGQIANRDGDPRLVVQTAASPSVFACDNRWSDRCGNPVSYGSPLQVGAGVRSGTLTDLSRNGNLITPDEANDGRTTRSTLRIQVDKNFLSGKTSLTGVCAYLNPVGAGADSPLNCVRVAGAGKSHGGPGSGGGGGGSGSGGGGVSSDVPALAGRVVYHSYVSYNDGSSRLFILDLSTGQLNAISSGWTNLVDPMNAHWSPDGTKIVFMARPKKGNRASAWFDVFLYAVGQPGNPVNLTNTVSQHEEDPKFSPDGRTIVYKTRPSTISEMDGSGALLNTIIASDGAERSMPYYTADGAAVWFSNRPSGASISASSIHILPVSGAPDAVVVDTPDVIDYYPIRDTIGQFLYSRTVSASNLFGQVYMYDGVQSVSLAFNTADADYSDAYPVDTRYIVLSSTKSGGHGGYDLYVADRNTGTLWSLDGYNTGVNTNREELGAAYTPN